MENKIPQNALHGDPFFNTTEVIIAFPPNLLVKYHNCLQEAADYVLQRLGVDKIDIAIVEGSGMLDLSDHLFKS